MYVIIFIDEILIYWRNEEDHASNLILVFLKLNEKEIHDKFSKCELLLMFVVFLGHIIFGDGITVDTQNIELVQSMRRPMSPTNFKSFFDLAG